MELKRTARGDAVGGAVNIKRKGTLLKCNQTDGLVRVNSRVGLWLGLEVRIELVAEV